MKTKEELFRIAAGHYLCNELPEDWFGLNIDQQIEFIYENMWEPFINNGLSADDVYDEIENLSIIMGRINVEGYTEGYAKALKTNSKDGSL